MAGTVRVDVANAVATIRLDRPPVNALSVAVQDEIAAAAIDVSARDDVRAVIVTGGDKVFAAGADVKEMAAMSHEEMTERAGPLQDSLTAVANIPKPTIAALAGYALGGGCELALACDLRVAADTVVLGQPEILLGVIPGAGGTQRLARLVGPSRAKELIFSGRLVSAQEALAIGLVDRVVPVAELEAAALEWALRFAAGAPLALAAAKTVIDRGLDADLSAGLALEREQFAALFGTADRTTGMQSFLEHGPGRAVFEGR